MSRYARTNRIQTPGRSTRISNATVKGVNYTGNVANGTANIVDMEGQGTAQTTE